MSQKEYEYHEGKQAQEDFEPFLASARRLDLFLKILEIV
jgi:hypothetical protein